MQSEPAAVTNNNPAALIPVYNHGAVVGGVLQKLPPGLPVILVDDGCDPSCKEALARAAAAPGVTLLTRRRNGGKGAAFRDGLEAARERGFTHVLQIDADGQHDAGRAAFFLAEAERRPEALICGCPRFDRTAPASRRQGRKVANAWAKIVTLSPALADALCGFRVYPEEPAWQVLRAEPVDPRMGFDAEILVRLYWRGVPVLFYPVDVRYPADGVSNFRPLRDNLRISWVYTRLFCGMLFRLPALLARQRRRI